MGDSERLPVSAWFPRREERVSYELHRAVARKLIDDPGAILYLVPGNLSKIRQHVSGRIAQGWLDEWERLVNARDVDGLLEVMLGTTQHSVEMRQNSPFAGALTDNERLAAIQLATADDVRR